MPCAYVNSERSKRSISRSNAPASQRCTATARFSSGQRIGSFVVSPPVHEFFISSRTRLGAVPFGRSVIFFELREKCGVDVDRVPQILEPEVLVRRVLIVVVIRDG